MVDTPTSRNRLRKQEVGTNNNTWGINLNQVLDCVDQVTDGVETIALTSAGGTYTLTTTNYTTADEAKNRVLIFTGVGTAAWDIVIPSVEHEYEIVNRYAGTITPKTSAGTGVAIPTLYNAIIYCDGVNVGNSAPTVFPGAIQVAGQIKVVTAGTDATDAVNKDQMETAIAAASPTPGTVRVSLNDTTAGYLGQKVTVQYTGLTTTQLAGLTGTQIEAAGANERVALKAPYVGGFLPGGSKTSQYTPVVGTEYSNDHTAGSWTTSLTGMTTPQIGQKIKLNCFGNYPPFLLGTVNSVSNVYLSPGFSGELTWSGAVWGWN